MIAFFKSYEWTCQCHLAIDGYRSVKDAMHAQDG